MYAHTCPTGGKLILRAITVVLAPMSLWGEWEGRIFAQALCERVVSEERAVWYSGEMGNSHPDGLDTLNRIVRGQDLAQGEPIATDRPDFTEASSTVPRGRVQFETGYTFTYDVEDGVIHRAHTAPELLVRYGFSDDIEFRLAWTYLWQNTKSGE
ncbi:MAG: hypothetical protein KatS3mg110_3867 [Pirellulaceae bacterium]|nr:MAG: hypothetical protein KatS3mg110_3867 [Pirellulaceae bacterium]